MAEFYCYSTNTITMTFVTNLVVHIISHQATVQTVPDAGNCLRVSGTKKKNIFEIKSKFKSEL